MDAAMTNERMLLAGRESVNRRFRKLILGSIALGALAIAGCGSASPKRTAAVAHPQAVEPQAGASRPPVGGRPPSLGQIKRELRAAHSPAYLRCANVSFRSSYAHAPATARVAIHRGSLSCPTARSVIAKALSTPHKTSGLSWQWFADGWGCSSGGDGTVTACADQHNVIAGTTPTPGGYWATP